MAINYTPYDAPKLGISGSEITFNYPPLIDVTWDKEQVIHKLADGGIKIYHKGYRPIIKLSWQEGWMDHSQYSGIQALYDDTVTGMNFIPRPDTYSNTKFAVRIVNDFNLKYQDGKFDYYEGTIELEGVEVTSTLTKWS